MLLIYLLYGYHMFNPEIFQFQIWYSTRFYHVIYVMAFFGLFFLGLGKLNPITINFRIPNSNIQHFLLVITIIFWTVNTLPLSFTVEERFEGIFILTRLSQLLLLILTILYAFQEKSTLSIITTILYTIYPLAIYSRSAVLAILILSAFYFLRGKIFKFILSIALVIFIYILVLGYRYHAGLEFLIEDSIDLLNTIDWNFYKIIFRSITPFLSIDIFFIHVFQYVPILDISNILTFIIYLLPFPGEWLPRELLIPRTSLSEYIGISERTFGLNSGLIPELFLWIGFLSLPIIYFFGRGVRLYLNSTSIPNTFKLLFFFTLIFFFIMSTIAPIRGSSRLMIYSLVMTYTWMKIKKLRFQKK